VFDRFFTVIRTWKLVPPEIAEIGVPEVSVIWNDVIDSDFSIQPPGVLVVRLPALVNGGPVVVVEK
jgi:hypothetical protein